MFLKSLALIPVILAAASGSSSLAGGESLDSSSVMEDLSTCAGFKASDFPFDSAFAHAEAVGGDFRAITMSDGADSFRKEYVYFYHPSGLTGGYFDSKHDVYRAAGSYKIKLSVSTAYDVYERYDAKLLSVSSDGLFWKFSLSCDFGFDATFERGYDLAALEVMDPESSDTDGRDSNSYALGSRFLLSGEGTSLSLKHETFDVVSLDTLFYVYRIPGVNSHSTDSFGGAYLFNATSAYSVVFSAMFSVPRSYGKVVGVSMEWTMYQDHDVYDGSALKSHAVLHNSASPSVNRLQFLSKGKGMEVTGWNDDLAKASGANWLAWHWAQKAEDWNFPFIQKASLNNGSIYSDVNTFSGNPYLVPSESKSAAEAMFNHYLTDDVYALHFDCRDYAMSVSEAPWWLVLADFLVPLGQAVLGVGTLLGGLGVSGFSSGEASYWEAGSVSVVSLLMEKDGKSYVLAVSHDSGHLDGSKGYVAPRSGLDLLSLILKCLLIGAGVIGACLLVYWVLGIFHVNFNVNGGHHGRKGNRSRRR